ncbi:MAG TPA: rod-binding protein [Dongiaceae bacterium]|nr:rod-binding protein [Dongiaceae bacterium]
MAASSSFPATALDRFGTLRQDAPPAIDTKDQAKAKAAAQDFEAFFVTHAFEDMFAELSSDPLFGGGEGEDMFKSLLLQEYGKQVAKAGGIGVSDMVQKQLLLLQETPK